MIALPVFFGSRHVGDVVHENGPRFIYDEVWLGSRDAFPISTSMPLQTKHVPAETLLPWATNLLPEAEQLTMVGRQLGIAPGDILGMLSAIGRDTAGALSFGAPGLTSEKFWKPIREETDLERIIEELPQKPFLAGDDGVSMSLAGVQTKLALAQDVNGTLHVPLEGAPSTHILKPDSDRLVGSVQNEAFCLTLARLCGLTVPAITTGKAGKRQYFLIERYDRVQRDDEWVRLHQEDFCQALGRYPSEKYERNSSGRGPTIVDMVGILRKHGLAPDALSMIDYVAFNILVCNTDAHAKNYSLMVQPGMARLAPLYDVMCADPYDGITRNLAQTIAGESRGDHIKQRQWVRMLEAGKFQPRLMLRRIHRLATSVLGNLEKALAQVDAMPAGGHAIMPAVMRAVERRSRAVLAGLEEL